MIASLLMIEMESMIEVVKVKVKVKVKLIAMKMHRHSRIGMETKNQVMRCQISSIVGIE